MLLRFWPVILWFWLAILSALLIRHRTKMTKKGGQRMVNVGWLKKFFTSDIS
jgi:hypothetical protein